MRTICLDIGEKRIGVAVSDLLDLTAQGVETIWSKGSAKDADRIAEICRQYETTHILCGLPLNMDGSEGFQAQRVKVLADLLAQMGYEIRFQDERLTTKLATNVLLQADMRRSKRKEVVDKLAATYILQSFLDGGGWKTLPSGEEHKKVFLSEVWYMNEEKMNGQDMELDQEAIVELIDDDGNELSFEHLMSLEHNGSIYICLAPLEPMEDVAEDELVIMKILQDENGNDYYSTIESEQELNEVFEKYLELAEADEEE